MTNRNLLQFLACSNLLGAYPLFYSMLQQVSETGYGLDLAGRVIETLCSSEHPAGFIHHVEELVLSVVERFERRGRCCAAVANGT